MTKTYCIANHKGGTGKSTTTLNLGAALAITGKKVLLIDLDPQANLTIMLGIYAVPELSMYDIMTQSCKTSQAILHIQESLHLLPSSLDLSAVELQIANLADRESILKNMIKPVLRYYDYVLIDAAPSMNLLTINGLVACQKILIPVQTEFIALNGLTKFIEIIEKVKSLNPKLDIAGIIATRYDNRKILNRSVVEKIRELYPDKIMNTIIRENVAIAESVANAMDIFAYARRSNGAEDFMSLTNEILKIESNSDEQKK